MCLDLLETFIRGLLLNYIFVFLGNGCNVAGFLTIFGNILSVYTLTVITTERWYTITWAIHLNKRLKLRNAVKVMIAGWICAIFMATLPLVGVSNYSKTSICLPLENKGKADTIYLSTLLAFNALAFGLICVCYGSMYKSIREGKYTIKLLNLNEDHILTNAVNKCQSTRIDGFFYSTMFHLSIMYLYDVNFYNNDDINRFKTINQKILRLYLRLTLKSRD